MKTTTQRKEYTKNTHNLNTHKTWSLFGKVSLGIAEIQFKETRAMENAGQLDDNKIERKENKTKYGGRSL